jgi:hypothetical protein
MSAQHDDHGSTPAAWTAVSIIMIAFLVGGLGILIGQAWVFWAGVVLVAVGVIVGKVMQMMGMGAPQAS